MKAVVAWARDGQLKQETIHALALYWPMLDVCTHKLDPDDESAYPRLLAEYWARKHDFAVIEPDIVIRADVSEAFHSCPEWYCCFPYAWLTDVGPALGCTRFRKELLETHPDCMRNVLRQNVGWRQTDVVLMRHVLARDLGIQPHVHLPPVQHLNPDKQLLPEANPEPLMEVPHW